MHKKARAKLLFCLSKPITFLPFSLLSSSLLMFPTVCLHVPQTRKPLIYLKLVIIGNWGSTFGRQGGVIRQGGGRVRDEGYGGGLQGKV